MAVTASASETHHAASRQALVENAFATADANGDGTISLFELKGLCKKICDLPKALPLDEFDRLIVGVLHAFDSNSAGTLSFDTFIAAYNNLADQLRTFTLPTRAPAATPASSRAPNPIAEASEPAGDPMVSQWTLRDWVSTTDINGVVAEALGRYAGGDGPQALKFLQAIDGREVLATRMRADSKLLDAMVDALASAVNALQMSATDSAAELQDKFLQAGAGLLSYGGLNKFFGGLEALVGSPHPRIRGAMVVEHCEHSDSKVEFLTGNYGISTTSEIEWKFVAEPEDRRYWPVETRMVFALQSRGAEGQRRFPKRVKRQPMALGELDERTAKVNARLRTMLEPALELEESIAARLYTGPSEPSPSKPTTPPPCQPAPTE